MLAQNVLNQRTDIENFLIDSIALCRREIAAERTQRLAGGAPATSGGADGQQQSRTLSPPALAPRSAGAAVAGGFLQKGGGAGGAPRLTPRAQISTQLRFVSKPQPKIVTPQQVDLRDLSWEQRERIFRVLFSKINASRPPRSAPPPNEPLPPVVSSYLLQQPASPPSTAPDPQSDLRGAASMGEAPKLS
ncbi:hypothetical protein PAPYR_9643 [Paratrimastix pyriformis]|uniref:Uncharacterized protein n=1 Tax=Paratrimastix pyriformis TaxID=342808 RepID=A0ABQ8UAH4_9EUKA|nr:hypothetical protein PAPYR_9643 [Paratrimastix pyriformis]